MSLVGALSKETLYSSKAGAAADTENGEEKNLRETFSQFVCRFAEEVEEKIKSGNDGPSIQTGASSYTKKEWERLLRRVDAAQKKLEENEGNTGRASEKRMENGEKEKSSLLEEMLAEVPKEEKGDSLEIFEQKPDMLLLTYTQTIYSSNDKSKEDTVYFTFYDTDGIYCKKSGESGFAWKIPLKDSSQYEKVMEYLKKYEGQDNLWFTSRKDFWRDFLEDKIDLEWSIPFENDKQREKFKPYVPPEPMKPVHRTIAQRLELYYEMHPEDKGKRCILYNGKWYTMEEMVMLCDKMEREIMQKIARGEKDDRVVELDFGGLKDCQRVG